MTAVDVLRGRLSTVETLGYASMFFALGMIVGIETVMRGAYQPTPSVLGKTPAWVVQVRTIRNLMVFVAVIGLAVGLASNYARVNKVIQ